MKDLDLIPDLIGPHLDVIFCGTAAGTRSAAVGAYYAGRGNRFWRVLHATHLTPRQFEPSEFRLLLEYRIGLTDIVKDQAGMDGQIKFHESGPKILSRKIRKFRPRFICFNGKQAAKVYFDRSNITYGLQDEHIGSTRIFVAPSTSAAGNAYWDQAIWQDLADLIRMQRFA